MAKLIGIAGSLRKGSYNAALLRVAAIEHLLMEKRIGTRDDLIRSREFVDSRRTQQ